MFLHNITFFFATTSCNHWGGKRSTIQVVMWGNDAEALPHDRSQEGQEEKQPKLYWFSSSQITGGSFSGRIKLFLQLPLVVATEC